MSCSICAGSFFFSSLKFVGLSICVYFLRKFNYLFFSFRKRRMRGFIRLYHFFHKDYGFIKPLFGTGTETPCKYIPLYQRRNNPYTYCIGACAIRCWYILTMEKKFPRGNCSAPLRYHLTHLHLTRYSYWNIKKNQPSTLFSKHHRFSLLTFYKESTRSRLLMQMRVCKKKRKKRNRNVTNVFVAIYRVFIDESAVIAIAMLPTRARWKTACWQVNYQETDEKCIWQTDYRARSVPVEGLGLWSGKGKHTHGDLPRVRWPWQLAVHPPFH